MTLLVKIAAVALTASFVSLNGFAAPLTLTHGPSGSGQIEVTVTFDQTPVTLQLDTGAHITQLRRDVWNARYPRLAQDTAASASGVAYACDVISVASVQIDEQRKGPMAVSRCDAPGASQLFALNFFAGQRLTFNFQTASLETDDPGARGLYPLKMLSQGHVVVGVTLAGSSASAVFDTGAGLSTIDQPFVDAHPDAFTYVKDMSNVSDSGGTGVAMKLYKIKELKIKDQRLKNAAVLAFDFGQRLRDYFGAGTPLVLGFNIITRYNWTLDLQNQLWDVEPFDQ